MALGINIFKDWFVTALFISKCYLVQLRFFISYVINTLFKHLADKE